MDIGKKIRSLRLGMNLTQEELANRLELTKGYISQLENNLTFPSINTLFGILEVLGVRPFEFLKSQKMKNKPLYMEKMIFMNKNQKN